jgi:Ca2+-binding EF-hand superfamily protein
LLDFRAPTVPQAARRRNREYRRDQALELKKLELESIYYVLGESTGQRNGLDAASFSLTHGLFAELDTDHDGNVDQRELAELLKARADVLVNVHFAPDAAEKPLAESQPPTLELEHLSDDLIAAGAKSYSSPSGLRIELPGLQLAIAATDLAQPPKNNSRVYSNWQVQVRAGQVEDAVFGWLDVNHDERLKTRELAGATARLAELDRDGRGHVMASDVPEQLSCYVVRGAAPTDGTGMSAPAAAPPTSLPAWLKAMDGNGDGEISPREFLGTREQFTTLDKNGDGYLDASEAQPAAAAP